MLILFFHIMNIWVIMQERKYSLAKKRKREKEQEIVVRAVLLLCSVISNLILIRTRKLTRKMRKTPRESSSRGGAKYVKNMACLNIL
jgi:hypothetical protein